MGFDAGRLRHVVDIQRRVDVQDEEEGGITTTWKTFYSDVRAAIEPLSVREAISASKETSAVTARVVIRFRPGLDAAQRIVHKCCTSYMTQEIYNPQGFLRDLETGLEYVTIPCSQGANEG